MNEIRYVNIPGNFITIDVEEWFHILNANIPEKKDWETLPSIAEKGTYKILEILEKSNNKATFFVLGWVAEKYPKLIRDISNLGHEIASHGYYHEELYKISEEKWKEDVLKSKYILEDITGKEVIGYRAPGFSSLNYVETIKKLSDLGFKYDSSLFPAKRETGGNNKFDSRPFYLIQKGLKIYEFPVSVYKNGVFSIPLGGGYSRITPIPLLRHVIKKVKKLNNGYFLFYLHPREVLKEQPKLSDLPLIKKYKTYVGLKNYDKKISILSENYNFVSIKDSSVFKT